MMDVISAIEIRLPEEQWQGMTDRLRMRITKEVADAAPPRPSRPLLSSSWKNWLAWDFGVPALAAFAAVMLFTVGLYKMVSPIVEQNPPATLTAVEQPTPFDPDNLVLDPVTADFLEQSELLLRNVMKLAPADTEDLQEAQRVAVQHLIRIDQRMQAVSSAPPVQTVMSKYETILREIKNLRERTAAEDIFDIQTRIERNGLIDDMKAFRPPVTVADVVVEEHE
jgi:hypothetical protein